MTASLAAGVTFFQYRNKAGSRKQIYEVSLRLAAIARREAAFFIVNDHADIALAAGADGVHLGQDDLPVRDARKLLGRERIIGISTHSTAQAVDARNGGADYIGFGPIFPSTTKDAGSMKGTAAITAVKYAVSIPVIAIGGINHGNARESIRAGADGVAIISAILSAPDPGDSAAAMIRIIAEAHSTQSSIATTRTGGST